MLPSSGLGRINDTNGLFSGWNHDNVILIASPGRYCTKGCTKPPFDAPPFCRNSTRILTVKNVQHSLCVAAGSASSSLQRSETPKIKGIAQTFEPKPSIN